MERQIMTVPRRNKNRGYQQLRVWQDAIELFRQVFELVRPWRYEYKKLASQLMSSADSVHRNIAEGYCRRSIKEYLNFLNIALGSLGETVSAFHAYRITGQIDEQTFETMDALMFRLENSLLKLVESLERKHNSGDWIETLIETKQPDL
jgi:four helix bundle protein